MTTPTPNSKESCDICALSRCHAESMVEIWLQEKKFGLCHLHWHEYCDPDLEPEIRKRLKVLPRALKEDTNETLVSICRRIANSAGLYEHSNQDN